MESFQKLISLSFFSLIIINSSLAHNILPRTNPSVQKICKQTDYPSLCVSAVSPYAKGKKCNLIDAVSFSIKASVETTNMAVSALKRIAKLSPAAPRLASVFKDSLGNYGDALFDYKQAQDALLQRDWGTVNTMLSGAISSFGECDDLIVGLHLSTLSEFNAKLINMTTNSLAITNIIEPHV